ncbi:MAG: hypothetical protein LCH61_15105, partial [Proteobacteria bacterium]|nr:hypothetical protein [Pseudomonadota bacterium]
KGKSYRLTTRKQRGKHIQPGSLLNENAGSNLSGNQQPILPAVSTPLHLAGSGPSIADINSDHLTRVRSDKNIISTLRPIYQHLILILVNEPMSCSLSCVVTNF